MLRLNSDLFHQMRSYLNFREIHATRPVASLWSDVGPVPKHITLTDVAPSISPIACFKNVTFLAVQGSSAVVKMHWQRIVYESQSSLTNLTICTPSEISFIPELPNVTQLELFNITNLSVSNKLLKKCPSLEVFTYWCSESVNESPTFDFLNIPKIKEIFFSSGGNFFMKHIVNIELVDHEFGIWLQTDTTGLAIDWLLNKNKNVALVLADGPEALLCIDLAAVTIGKPIENIEKLKEWITAALKCRDVPIQFAETMSLEAKFKAAACLAATGMFSKEKIKDMI